MSSGARAPSWPTLRWIVRSERRSSKTSHGARSSTLSVTNGAGKTTALRILMDLTRADSGQAEVLGMDPRVEGPRLRAHVGYVPEGQKWEHRWMTVGGLFRHHARYFPAWDEAYAHRLSSRLELPQDSLYGTLSKGQARRVQLVLALAHRPPVLFLDEPPSERGYFWSLPVARAPHTFLRVGLGWVLLMGVCLGAMLVSVGVSALFASRVPGAELAFGLWYLPLAAATLA